MIQWTKNERFDDSWKLRIQRMAAHLTGVTSVVDYGCGMEWLREFLPPGVAYFPSDYTARSAETIVCDYNNWEFPNAVADAGFVSGCLEYMACPEWFIEQLATHAELLVISYCTLDETPSIKQRRRNNWANDLKEADLIGLCAKYKLALVSVDRAILHNPIFVFRRTKPLSQWGVLSYNGSPSGDLHNLGDYIQSLAGAELAAVDISDAPTVNKERIAQYVGRPLRLVMNGWFAHSSDALPAPANIAAEVLSFHFKRVSWSNDKMRSVVEWLQNVGPIGCRDYHTLHWAEENGIAAYLSGCITPLTGALGKSSERTEDIIVVDPWLPRRRKWSSIRHAIGAVGTRPFVVLHILQEMDAGFHAKSVFDAALFVGIYGQFLSRRVLMKAKWRTHIFSRSSFTTQASIMEHARKLLLDYGRASMVITTRIHCALPCSGMDTPVLFVHGNDGDGRYRGLIERFTAIRVDENGTVNQSDLAQAALGKQLDSPIPPQRSFESEERTEMLQMLARHQAMKSQ